MITLTRYRGTIFTIPSRTIEAIESGTNTRLLLVSGERVVVEESPEEVLRRILAYRRRLVHGLPPLLPHRPS